MSPHLIETLVWGSVVTLALMGYGYSMFKLGMKAGGDAVHEWYASHKDVCTAFVEKQAD